MKNLIEENGITYELNGEIYYPVLEAPEQKHSIVKYGDLHLAFLKEHRKATYITLLTTGKLYGYPHEVAEQARGQLRKITADLACQRGIDETHKSADPMRWVHEVNNCKASAEEIVLRELLCK